MQVSRGVEEAIEVGIQEMVVDSWGIEEQLIRSKNRSSIDPPGVKKLSRRQELSRSIHQVWRRCRGGIKEVSSHFLKLVFLEWKTQTWMQPNMHLNQWSNQHNNLSKSSLNKNFKYMDLKNTHTHTLNKSNQFYISKTKLRQFSEHTLTHVKPYDGQIILYLHIYQE